MGAPPKPTADPPGLRDQVAALLDEWARQLDEAPLDKSQTAFITQLRNTGLLKVGAILAVELVLLLAQGCK